jgi:hypothetical protein
LIWPKTLIFIFLFLHFDLHAQEMMLDGWKYFKTEDEVLDRIIDKHIPVISIENPENREAFKEKIKDWNPQISNWARIDFLQSVNIKVQTRIFEFAYGYHLYDSSEEFNSNEKIETKNFGPTFDVRYTIVHSLNLFSYYNYKMLRKNNYTHDENKATYSFPFNHSFEAGIFYRNKFSRWGWKFSGAREELSFVSYNNLLYRNYGAILAHLQVTTNTIYWAGGTLSYRFPFLKKGGYLNLSYYRAVIGDKELEDGTFEENIKGDKASFNLKYYFLGRFWLNFYYQMVILKGNTEIQQAQYGLYLGHSL